MDVCRKESKGDKRAFFSIGDKYAHGCIPEGESRAPSLEILDQVPSKSPTPFDKFLERKNAAVFTLTGGSDARTSDLLEPSIKPQSMLGRESSGKKVCDSTKPNSSSGRELVFDDQVIKVSTGSTSNQTDGHHGRKHVESDNLQEMEGIYLKPDGFRPNESLDINTADIRVKENFDRTTYGYLKTCDIQETDNVRRETGDFQRCQNIETKTDEVEGNKSIEIMKEGRGDMEPLNLIVNLESRLEQSICSRKSNDRFTSPSLDAQQISAGILDAAISDAKLSEFTACHKHDCNQDRPKLSHSHTQSVLDVSNGHLGKYCAINGAYSDTKLPVTKETSSNLPAICAGNDDSVIKILSKEEYSPSQATADYLISNEDTQNGVDGTEKAIILPKRQESVKKKRCSQLAKAKLLNFAQKETESTKRVTVWSVGIFHRWMNKDKDMSRLPQLIKMTVPQINTYLCKFLVHARKIDGTRYPSKSLQALGQGLLRYVRNNRVYKRRECGSTEGIFKPVNQVLAMELRRTMYYEELAGRTPKVRQRRRPLPSKKNPVIKNSQKKQEDPVLQDGAGMCMHEGTDAKDVLTEIDGKKESVLSTVVLSTECVDAASHSKPLQREDCETKTKTNVFRPLKIPHELETIDCNNVSEKRLLRTSSKETEECHRKTSTEKNTRWAVHHFNKWRVSKQRQESLMIPEIQDMSVKDVNSYLVEFITTVVKTDGSEYIPSCLYSLACGLLRYTRNHSRYDLDFMNSKDERFTEFQAALSYKIKSLEPENTEERQKLLPLRHLSSNEEDKLWRYHVFGMETAKSLQYTVLYYNFKIFDIKSYALHRILQRNQFSIVEEDGARVLRFDSLQLDPNTESEEEKQSRVITFRNEHEGQDIVGLYEVYFEAVGNTGPFYKRLVGFQGPILRFTEQNVGIRSLQAMWFDICKAVSLESG